MTVPLPRIRGDLIYIAASMETLPVVKSIAGALSVEKRAFKDTPHDLWFTMPYTPGHTLAYNRAARAKIPGPAFASWKYPGFYQPFGHQRFTVDFFTQHRRCFCFNGMGSGKSMSALWATEYLRERGEVKRTLIISPLSTLRVVWVDELFKVAPSRVMAVAHGSKQIREKALFGNAEYVVINHDGLRFVDIKAVAAAFDHVIVDELGVFRTWQSGSMPARYKALLTLAHHPSVRRFWGMTGTPTPNSPMDAWALVKLVDPAFSVSKTRFQTVTMQQITEFKWVPKPAASEYVAGLLQPSIRFSREEVLAYLPPQVFTTRQVDLTAEQAQMRNTIRAAYKAEFKGKAVSAANAAILLSKILQVATGSVRGDDEASPVVELPAEPRLNELTDLVLEAGGKALVFCNYRAPIDRVVKHLRSKGISAAAVHGDVSAGRRATLYRDFQEKTDPRVLVAHPGTTAHGITLTAASLIVWFGPTFSAELYEQANARAHRPGQKRSVLIAHLVGTPEEAAVYRTLRERGAMQQTLLELAKAVTD
jgi:SNF2 family DNA or RNA helicase